MEIRKLRTGDIENLLLFNQRVFPDKQIDSKEYLEFWLSRKANAIDDILIMINDDGLVVGQNLMSEMTYFYGGCKINTVWGFDLIIDEEYRKESWGIDFMMKAKELYPHTFATGSGPHAKAINLKLGMKDLGNLRKYVGIVSPFHLLTYRKKFIDYDRYPKDIKVGKCVYRKAEIDQLPEFDSPFNDDLLEICRDREFLVWRFFNNLHEYVFYLRDDSRAYFVLRSIEIKKFRMMELVDYRCVNSEANFEEIFQAASRVTRKVNLSYMVCGSSLTAMDAVLERHFFKSIGRPRPILGYMKCKDKQDDINNRKFCYVTLADSDGETNWV